MDSTLLTAINGDGYGATDNPFSTTSKDPQSLHTKSSLSRTSSFLSCSSSFRSPSFSSYTAETHLNTPISSYPFSGIPFSWEQSPGIPKEYSKSHSSSSLESKYSSSSTILLPLPPKTHPLEKFGGGKKSLSRPESFQEDPFTAALMKCSADRRTSSSTVKMSRSLSDRFGFIDNVSCMRSCEVSEPNVLLPRLTGRSDGRSTSDDMRRNRPSHR